MLIERVTVESRGAQPDDDIPNAGITVNHLDAGTLAGGPVAVPEASTWVMGFLAVGAVGFMARRKRVS